MAVILKKPPSVFLDSQRHILIICLSILLSIPFSQTTLAQGDIFNIVTSLDFENTPLGGYSYNDWGRDWNWPTWQNGLDKTVIEDNEGDRAMEFNFPLGSRGPNEGGGQWLSPFESGYEEVYMSYNLMFRPGFEWVLGGKLPGLGGGSNPGGGTVVNWDDGFSVRIMWSRDTGPEGTMFFYVYNIDKVHAYGDVYTFRDTYWDVSDRIWYNMTIRVVLNSLDADKLISDPQNAGNKDGIMEFFLDGKLIFSQTGMLFRNLSSIWVDTQHITSFFGGATHEWAAVRDEWILLDDFYVFTYKDGVNVPRGRTASSPGRMLELPNLKGAVADPTDTEAPTVPSGLTVTGVTGFSVNLDWNASTDNVFLKGYRVFVNGTEVGTSVSNSFKISELNSNTTYDISVSAYDGSSNESEQSGVLSVTTVAADSESPTIPTGLRLTESTDNSISIAWEVSTDNIGVEGYRIYLNGNVVGSSVNNLYSALGLNPSTEYTITVTAYDESQNESPQTTILLASTLAPDNEAPSTPEGVLTTLVTKNSIGLVWNNSSDNIGVSGYYINVNDERVGTSYTNSYTATQLSSGLDYAISVSAFDAALNKSPASNVVYATTKKPDETTSPTLPDISIVEVKKSTSMPQAVSEINSFGYAELEDYGLLVSKNEDIFQEGQVIYALQDNSEVKNLGRVTQDLQLIYNFSEGMGVQISDLSGSDEPLDLNTNDPLTTKWLPGQGLVVDGNTIISSDEAPTSLINSVSSSNEITMEVWIKSAAINQSGPARILSISKDNTTRLATIGQTGNDASYDFNVRLTTSFTDSNGIPEITTSEKFISLDLHHIIYTRDKMGIEKIFINGVERYSGMRGGHILSSEDNYFTLANELSGERPWNGTYYLVAIYNRSLSTDEVVQNYRAGFGEIQFTTDLLVEPNIPYYLTPFARTDQGVVYGEVESILVENVLYSSEEDSIYMAIYPNPSNGDFKLHIKYTNPDELPAHIRIADMSGQIIYTRNLEVSDEIINIDEDLLLSTQIQEGFYSLILIVGNQSIARKLIIHG